MHHTTIEQVSGPPSDKPLATSSSLSSSKSNTGGETASKTASEAAKGKQREDNLPPIRPAGISFGVELEFMVAWVYEDKADPDQDIADKLPPLLRVPRDPDSESSDRRTDHIHRQVRKALVDIGLPVSEAEGYAPGSIQQRQADAGGISAFSITRDLSLNEYLPGSGYHFTGVELVSPAMWDRDNSFDLIQLALTTVTSSFRCRVNQTCGFHVHVGVGRERRIDARTLRKLGAFIWAASPLLSVLHPPHRAQHMYSRGVRQYNLSRLGSGDPQAAARAWGTLSDADQAMARFSGRDRWLGEAYHIADDGMIKRIRRYVREEEADRRGLLSRTELGALAIEVEMGEDPSFRELGEPARHGQNRRYMAPLNGSNSSSSSASEKNEPWRRYGPPKIDMQPPAGVTAKPKRYEIEPLAPPRPRKPVFVRTIPPVPLRRREDLGQGECGGSIADSDKPDGDRDSSYPDSEDGQLDPPKRQDVMSGVATMLGADFSAGLVGSLLCNHRMAKLAAYNLASYRLLPYALGGEPDPEVEGDPFNECLRNTTVEVREAAGTLRAGWVRTWARTWCGILRWCRDASEADFLAVMRLVAWAQEEGGRYDVVDLLVDLGMPEEARACETRLRRGENERMEQEEFGDPDLEDLEEFGEFQMSGVMSDGARPRFEIE
ncbi:hypothetical protein ACRALDRAFT_1080509 [Sodiomyces alcalophilus JCM 7366]|uniref:uncharacterized protein n=1 Tax=Sodiomyces alcalophilus JCM 7366 TaxID=591952 RepID=UPI0039B65F94